MAITLDLHEGDEPTDITLAAEWLTGAGIRATFLVPTAMMQQPGYVPPLRELGSLGHEVGTHTHKHDQEEIHALMEGDASRLGFMEVSKRLFEDLFGQSPVSFRSAAWCPLGPAALDELQRLGYRVDASATPQRLGILSSLPSHCGSLRASRRPHFLRPGVLEVPTSTLLVPAGSPTFLTFRRLLSLAYVRVLLAEARCFRDRVVVLQFHASDFNPESVTKQQRRRLRLEDFVLNRYGGFGFKHFLRETNASRITSMTHALIDLAASCRRVTLAEVTRLAAPMISSQEALTFPFAAPAPLAFAARGLGLSPSARTSRAS